ncbi:MAG: hypothetical protein K2I06_14560 [Ruminococcus sp.]|nr:hypothetical protein [Ruminococcus sp.]
MVKNNRSINICKMISGDKEAIRKSLFSESKYVRMDALIWATYHCITENDIIERIKDLKKDNAVLSGYTIGNFAIAALENLNSEKYDGNDEYQKSLIKNFVPSKEKAAEILKINSN